MFVTIPVAIAGPRKANRPQHGSDSKVGTSAPDRSQPALLIVAISNPDFVEGKTGHSKEVKGPGVENSR